MGCFLGDRETMNECILKVPTSAEVTYEYKTDVLKSYSHNEEAYAMRDAPRMSFSYTYSITDSKEIQNEISKARKLGNVGEYLIPNWLGAIKGCTVKSGVNYINVPHANDFVYGMYVCLYIDENKHEIVRISDKDTEKDRIKFESKLEETVENVTILPMYICSNKGEVSFTCVNTFQNGLQYEAQVMDACYSAFVEHDVTYLGHDVFENFALSGTPTNAISQDILENDYEIGRTDRTTFNTRTYDEISLDVVCNGQEERARLVNFAKRRRGKVNPFFLPSGNSDIIKAPYTSELVGNNLYARHNDYYDYTVRPYIAIRCGEKLYCATVKKVTPRVVYKDGEYYDLLELREDLQCKYSDISYISTLLFVRFSEDSFTYTHSGYDCVTATLNVVETNYRDNVDVEDSDVYFYKDVFDPDCVLLCTFENNFVNEAYDKKKISFIPICEGKQVTHEFVKGRGFGGMNTGVRRTDKEYNLPLGVFMSETGEKIYDTSESFTIEFGFTEDDNAGIVTYSSLWNKNYAYNITYQDLIKVKDNYSRLLQNGGEFANKYISTPISLIYQRGKVDEKKFPTLLSGNNNYLFATDPYNVIDGMTVGIDKDARGSIDSNDHGKYYSYVPISKWEENNKYHDVAFVYEKENNRGYLFVDGYCNSVINNCYNLNNVSTAKNQKLSIHAYGCIFEYIKVTKKALYTREYVPKRYKPKLGDIWRGKKRNEIDTVTVCNMEPTFSPPMNGNEVYSSIAYNMNTTPFLNTGVAQDEYYNYSATAFYQSFSKKYKSKPCNAIVKNEDEKYPFSKMFGNFSVTPNIAVTLSPKGMKKYFLKNPSKQFDWSFQFWVKGGTVFCNADGYYGNGDTSTRFFKFEINNNSNLQRIYVVCGNDSLISSNRQEYRLVFGNKGTGQKKVIPLPNNDLHHVCVTRSMADKAVFVYIDKQLVEIIDVTKDKNFHLGTGSGNPPSNSLYWAYFFSCYLDDDYD